MCMQKKSICFKLELFIVSLKKKAYNKQSHSSKRETAYS